jgi:hypothetical protein
MLDALAQATELSPEDFSAVRTAMMEILQTLTTSLDHSKSISTPALTNVPAGSPLHDLIMDRGDIRLTYPAGDSISGEWLSKLMARLEGVLSRLKRVHFKSLGSLLACQERLEAEWRSCSLDSAQKHPATVASTDA